MSFVRLDSAAVDTAAAAAAAAILATGARRLASDFRPRGGCEAPRRASQEARLGPPWTCGREGIRRVQGYSWNCKLSMWLSLILTVES